MGLCSHGQLKVIFASSNSELENQVAEPNPLKKHCSKFQALQYKSTSTPPVGRN